MLSPLSPGMQTCLQPAAAAREGRRREEGLEENYPALAQPTLVLTATSQGRDLGAWQALSEPWSWPQALTPV